jgi:hypothetical protein
VVLTGSRATRAQQLADQIENCNSLLCDGRFQEHEVTTDEKDHAHLRPGVLRHFADDFQGAHRVEAEAVHDDALGLLDELSNPEIHCFGASRPQPR